MVVGHHFKQWFVTWWFVAACFSWLTFGYGTISWVASIVSFECFNLTSHSNLLSHEELEIEKLENWVLFSTL